MEDREFHKQECNHRWYWLLPRDGVWWRKCWDCKIEESTTHKFESWAARKQGLL